MSTNNNTEGTTVEKPAILAVVQEYLEASPETFTAGQVQVVSDYVRTLRERIEDVGVRAARDNNWCGEFGATMTRMFPDGPVDGHGAWRDSDGYDCSMCYRDRNGYDRNGYDVNGYNRDGFSTEGYNRAGFSAHGIDRDGFDATGVNLWGFRRSVYMDTLGNLSQSVYGPDGFNYRGVDRDGYDRDGYDRNGYDRDGYSRPGRYDRDGCDAAGYNRYGYDRDGYTRWGMSASRTFRAHRMSPEAVAVARAARAAREGASGNTGTDSGAGE